MELLFVDGAKRQRRYFLFHIPLVLEKKMELVQLGEFQKHVGVVRVRELSAPVDWTQDRQKVIRAIERLVTV